jgi:hypothetical protein
MSSSSPRNANSRSKSSHASARKRTQEVETAEPGEVTEAIVPPPGATAADLATSALDAATGSPAGPRPDELSSNGSENSPLGREILGAAEDMAGDWSPEPPEGRPPGGPPPATPLEMMDETDLIEQGQAGASGLILGGSAPPAMRDEEFLRRVVLPPLPAQPAGSLPQAGFYSDSDKTIISDPPSPEMVASWGRPTAAERVRAIKRRLQVRVELTTLKLLGLLTGSALAGGIIGGLLTSVPTADAGAQRPAAAAAVIARPPAVVPTQAPAVIPLPTVPRPTVEALPPPPNYISPDDQPPVKTRRAYRRGAAAGRKVKKEWVDPFEQ